MEYELLKEIDAQYLLEYLNDLSSTITNWNDRINEVFNEYNELIEYDSSNNYAIDDKKIQFDELCKQYYYEISKKMKRTQLEISSLCS